MAISHLRDFKDISNKIYRIEKELCMRFWGRPMTGPPDVGRHINYSTFKQAFYAESNKLKISEVEAVFYYENLHF